jgi:pyrroline-5-carboxylate reductase
VSARRTMRVGIVGAGVMAEAMMSGLLADRAVQPEQLVASHPRRERRQLLVERHGIRAVGPNRQALDDADIVVLAVKPQMLGAVMRELCGALRPAQVALSIVAGATLRTLTDGLAHQAVVRAMPNTPAQIRRGITVWTASPSCTAEQRDLARGVLRALGDEREVADEEFVAMATALSGTGPTYLFAVMEALIDAGVHMGFPRELAHDLVVETLRFAESLASLPPGALSDTKALGRDLIEMGTDAAMTRMFDVISVRLRSEEHLAALRSYVANLRRSRAP